MILRLSQKLNTKIKAGPLKTLSLDENPFADWSAHLFVADRTQYILLSNTKTLYSTVMFAKGITSDSQFIERALSSIRELLEHDGHEAVYRQFIIPATGSVRFAKALDRSVTSSMNQLVEFATFGLSDGERSPFDVGFKLNDILLSAIAPSKAEKYGKPEVAFEALVKSIASSTSEKHAPTPQMTHPLPHTPVEWLNEIKLAIADAAEAKPFGPIVGATITDANLFHLAPLVCLKFRGRKTNGREAERVTEIALANYVVNSDPDGIDHGLQQRPLMAFILCYVAAHLALDLVNEQEAEAILNYCEKQLGEGMIP